MDTLTTILIAVPIAGLIAGLAAPVDKGGWAYLGERLKPARLSECPNDSKAVINYSSNTAGPWQAFCYTGRLPDPRGRGGERTRKSPAASVI